MKETFRVATYNIHKCKGLDLRASPQRIADVLGEIDADIIALQEVVSQEKLGTEDNQAHFIAERLGHEFRIGENRRLRGASYGNVVLTRFPIVKTHNFDLSVKGREPRGCLHADIELAAGKFLHVYNLHLGTSFFERRRQGQKLLNEKILNRRHFAPRVLLGDFNEWTQGLTSKLLKAHFSGADLRDFLGRRRTYPGVLPFLHLDHVYYDHHLEVIDAFVHRSRLSLVASDHLPIVVDFRLKS